MSEFKMNLLVADYETSGTDVRENKHQPLSWGMILVDPFTLETISEKYVEVAFDVDKYEWNTGAEKAHGLTIEGLSGNPSLEDGTAETWHWLLDNGINPKDSYITLAAHNPNFERMCFTYQNSLIDIKAKLTHRMVDTFSLGYGFASGFNSDEIFAKIGVVRQAHNAMEDAQAALDVIRLARRIGNEYFANL